MMSEGNMRRIILFNSLLVLHIYVGWCNADIKYAPVVMTESGPVRGIMKETLVEQRSYRAYLSIPYGKAHRFMRAEKPDVWTNVLNATESDNRCMQYDSKSEDVVGSEDCLKLHVYVPELTNQSSAWMPVMVWIHGGAFATGSPNPKEYGPDFFMEENVIVVAIAYRLNILGFLAVDHPDASGNAGLEDQRLALMWVQENIANFGGDPTRVTIFGESAGAASVDFHVLSDRSKGLFHRSISQSGGPLCNWAMIKPQSAYENAFKVGRSLGFKGNRSDELLKFLYTTDAKALVKAAWKSQPLSFLPTIQPPRLIPKEQAFLSKCPYLKLKTGDYNKVPRIMGYMKDEGLAFAKSGYNSILASWINQSQAIYDNLNISMIKNVQTANLEIDALLLLAKIITDSFFVAPIDLQQRYMSDKNEHEIFYYRYSLDSAYAWHKQYFNFSGAAHGDELPLIFIMQSVYTPTHTNVVEGRIRKTLIRLWTNFAKYGNPTPALDEDPWVNFLWKDSRLDGAMIDIGETIQETTRLADKELTVLVNERIIELTAFDNTGCTSSSISV